MSGRIPQRAHSARSGVALHALALYDAVLRAGRFDHATRYLITNEHIRAVEDAQSVSRILRPDDLPQVA
jgi:hypothetical protein